MIRTALLIIAGAVATVLLVACSDVGYYLQCASGHLDVMRRSRPIDELLADPDLPAARRDRLRQILAARNFASVALALPDNASYREFADLGRPYVVWNVVAAPEFSLNAQQWCFPVAGCVSYRGYFDEAAARDEADRLRARGFDVDVYGVQAYSTLNWFDDPVLNTFLDGPEPGAAALLFHELAHQVAYAAGDSRFNEAFARTVELEGVRRWLKANGNEAVWQRYQEQAVRAVAFQALLLQTRERLAAIYVEKLSDDEKRRAKTQVLAGMQTAYRDLKASWAGYAGYDQWMARDLNNARLVSVATYHDLVPAFEGLLAAVGGDLPVFYRKVAELAFLSSAERLARLEGYAPRVQAKVN